MEIIHSDDLQKFRENLKGRGRGAGRISSHRFWIKVNNRRHLEKTLRGLGLRSPGTYTNHSDSMACS